MTPQEDNDAPEQLSTRDKSGRVVGSDSAQLVFSGLVVPILIAYFLVYGEAGFFDRIYAKFGVPPAVSEIVLWGVAVVFYVFAIVGAWILTSEVKAHRLGHKCALVIAVLLTAPLCLAALLIVIPFLWERLNSMAGVVVVLFGFLSWQRWVMEDNYKKFRAIVNILTEIQQSVRNIEKEKTEPRAGWGE